MENPRLTSSHKVIEGIIANHTFYTIIFVIISLVITWASYKVSVKVYTKLDF